MQLKVKTYGIPWVTYENNTRTLYKMFIIKLQISKSFPNI